MHSFSDQGVQLLLTLTVFNKWDQGVTTVPSQPKFIRLPANREAYRAYVRAAVERFPQVRFFQVENEPMNTWADSPENFALLVQDTHDAIKSVNPDARVVLAGASTPQAVKEFYVPVIQRLAELGGPYFDVMDLHWSGQFEGGPDQYANYRELHAGTESDTLADTLEALRGALRDAGLPDRPIWITEQSDYSDGPAGFPPVSEVEHASELIKRHVYSLALGVEKVFWVSLVELSGWMGPVNNYWDNVGLIHNPANGDGMAHRKLAYHAYGSMVKTLDGCDWRQTQLLQDSEGVVVVRFLCRNEPVWVAWSDDGEATITLSGLSGESVLVISTVPEGLSGADVPEGDGVYPSRSEPISSGQVGLRVGRVPVHIHVN